MFQSLDLLVLTCLFVTAEAQTGQILQPQNVTLQRISGFEPHLFWEPPPHLENCTYECEVILINGERTKKGCVSPWKRYAVPERGSRWSVRTVCDGRHSEPVVISISHTELVKNLQCTIHSSKRTHCSWLPASHAPDLSFFYDLVNNDFSTPADKDEPQPLQACSLYTYTDGSRTGCDLQANILQKIHILFNGTLNNTLFRNSLKTYFKVRPPALNWTVVKTEKTFIINWIPPDVGHLSIWNFTINYTECNEQKIKSIIGDTTMAEMELVPHCPYHMAIRAQGKYMDAVTPWSDQKYFDADTDPKALVYVAIIIPLMVAVLAVLSFVIWGKNKDSICPKVPEPRDFLSDISDNNNKSTVRNLYIPAEEEESCKITLVIDPQNNKLDP